MPDSDFRVARAFLGTFRALFAPSICSYKPAQLAGETDLNDEVLDKLAAILAAAYLRYRETVATTALPFSELDTRAEQSVHGAVNGERRDG